MITTLQAIANKVSYDHLKESSVVTNTQRISALVSGVRMLLDEAKFPWARKEYTLVLSAGIQEYNLTTLLSDYDIDWGLYMVTRDGAELSPCDYALKSSTSNNRYYLSPDNKTIGFTKEILGTEEVIVWYYQTLTIPASVSATLNLSIPESALEAIACASTYYVHLGKRQRYDATNALKDYQVAKEKIVQKKASNKARNFPKTVPNIMAYHKVQRTYSID